MLWATVAYSLGIIGGVDLSRPAHWWVVAAAPFIAAAAYFASRRSWLGWALALGALFIRRSASHSGAPDIHPLGHHYSMLCGSAGTANHGACHPRPTSTACCLQRNSPDGWEGDEFDLSAVTFQVLFPPRDWHVGAKPQPNDSMVLRVSYGAPSALLEGDAEKQVERRVAALHHPSATLIKVGHHGGANATTPALLASAKPEFASISVGSDNSFGLPRTEVFGRLGDAGVHVHRTDIKGAISFFLESHSVTPSVAALQ